MRKLYTAVIALASCAAPFFAQAQKIGSQPIGLDQLTPAITRRACGTMEALEAQLAADPGLATRMAAIEAHTRRVATGGVATRQITAPSSGPIIIPVVVHVLYSTTAQDISDDQVKSQIAVLNEDYQKKNTDYSKTPSLYAGLVTNVGVQFVLAQRDPSGAATTGIIHKSTKVKSWSTNDAVKSSKRGGDDPWDASQYLNIWACNLGNGLLGYAQFPGGSPSTDGVVILYSAFGSRAKYSTGTYTSSYDLGRTATHEVGHWLNLRHIWGDDNGACTGSDQVDDTPNQASENYGCPTFPHVSCSNQGDMSMNYMDYVDDACMYMFSNGQGSRMNALFVSGGARASILTSLGGTAPRLLAASSPVTKLALYPNPATDMLTVDLPVGTDAAHASVRVYDLRGLEMPQARYNGQGQVQLSSLPKGLYYVTVDTGAGVVRQQLVKE